MGRFRELAGNAKYIYKEEGPKVFIDKLGYHIRARRHEKSDPRDFYSDVLFVNGCAYSVPHPIRYRVDHQLEQLNACGVTVRKVDEWNLTNDWLRTARVFIIYRCPYNDRIGEFIALAKKLNKTVLYDIDDLVIDTKYTDQIKYLDTMSVEERASYDAGVEAMQKTMLLCDGVITTTRGMADELAHYMPVVYVNRNIASEEMVYLSERAIRERDTLPFLSEEQVDSEEMRQWRNARKLSESRDASKVRIGYFSGSITHNDDFAYVLPAIVRLMEEHPQVELHIAGELSVPEELECFRNRVVAAPFMPWERLPRLIAGMDINIAPLIDNVFNRAKSENKWLEAALVKVPTVASNVGAFADVVEDGVTGILCDSSDQWYVSLKALVEDAALRKKIGQAAYDDCISSKTTVTAGAGLAMFIRDVQAPNIAFAVPSFVISGGNLVTFKHAKLMHDRGYDVTFLDAVGDDSWLKVDSLDLPVMSRCGHYGSVEGCPISGYFDKLVATFWETALFVERYHLAGEKYYLVQNQEQGFYEPLDYRRSGAAATYYADLSYVTISRWCQDWLRTKYGKTARFARNGLDLTVFRPAERDYSGRIRILVEGDCSVEYKNIDESFRIIDLLDPERFEIWYLSYKGEPKPYYRVDRFLHAVPHDQVAYVYQQCHILLKTSILESFSYPPLEMMATGGVSVVLSNPGNAEYLRDGENCLLFGQGEEERAARLIQSITDDEELRGKLVAGGFETAASRDWAKLEEEIVGLYE
ncbi:glycosyltransferase [Gordonibacter massiliensis (ex Traore et al. 2017)]|uniref:glycosyltransferase n=1 Tax=Gordonibacter massiliensis (ex Traore et al. 2017) TaxID=1841863 RepID=UPI001C8CE66C|nr:glycosyltransferase [Gordonibacter massiliensis (ex Traore et al. 2017)]MBX9033644.1 glycosyltransferase [Gordonibacter massiliensis (ex Traore et al. 2017)]